ncbi:MAG TPA: hypothetical protein VKS22_04695 [Candidatus Binataceae bacterium]|nr:hypothetical protein [Candidatus Binataceae bacterium]
MKVAAINATLLGIWSGIGAIRLSRIFDSLKESDKNLLTAEFKLRRGLETLTPIIGLSLPSEYFYSEQSDFRRLAEKLTNLMSGVEIKGTVDERGAEVLRLISAISGQYPFPNRMKYEQGKTLFEMETMDIHFRDKGKVINRIDDIIWLEGKLVTTIALFPQLIDSFMAGPEKAWRG